MKLRLCLLPLAKQLFHFAALELTQTAYMISVKRTSLLFSIAAGRLIFGEVVFGRRLLGGALMCAGGLLLALE